MKAKLVYLKAEQNIKVKQDKVYLGDICKMTSTDRLLLAKLKVVLIYDFAKKDKDRAVISILKVVETINKLDPDVEIVSLGEQDVILERVRKKKETKAWICAKVIFVSFVCFFGTAYTLMAFHNDVNIAKLFERIYDICGVSYNGGLGALEIGYSLGLGAGIILFYNHIGKRRITKDPTPLEIEMRIYECDVNQTLIDNADREGIEVDVN